jgi:hypothetical protein
VEVSASIFWARLRVRGRQSMASTVALLGGQLLHQLGVLGGPDEVDERRALAHQRHFVAAGRAHLEDDV